MLFFLFFSLFLAHTYKFPPYLYFPLQPILATHGCRCQPITSFSSHQVMMIMEGNAGDTSVYAGGVMPMGYATVTDNTVIAPLIPPPMYGSPTDSGSIPVSRKRPRHQPSPSPLVFPPNGGGSLTFLGQDVSFEIQNQQLEIDRFIVRQTEKVKMEIEERRKSYSRRMIAAMEESVGKKLRAKDEEIEKIGRLNWALEEKVKSLYLENQIWRELAQSSEATANELRNNLEQLLQVQEEEEEGAAAKNENDQPAAAAAMVEVEVEDAESWCGSNDKKEVKRGGWGRLCRKCGEEEARVVVLPCRHLCVCGGCGVSLESCPVCGCAKNGALDVNLSTSRHHNCC